MQFPQYQVVLLGPQVKYMLKTLSEKAASLNIPVQPINAMDYGMQRGDNVLDLCSVADSSGALRGVQMSSLYQSMIAAVEQSITPLAGRLGQQKYVIAIRDGFTTALPFMIIGSFMLVFIFSLLFTRHHQRFCPRLAGFLTAVS